LHDYNVSIDIWSAGCVLVEMMTGTALFPCQDNEDLVRAISAFVGLERIKEAFPSIDFVCESEAEAAASEGTDLRTLLKGHNEKLVDLAVRMLDPNPMTRISAKDALAMPVFTETGPVTG
jgi:serine/threonine protein kinase